MKHKAIKNQETDELFKAVLSLKTMQECYNFFEDICTIGEMQAISQRYTVAKMLNDNVKYADIAEKTGASTATISRVNRCLVYGAGGYRLALERTKEKV